MKKEKTDENLIQNLSVVSHEIQTPVNLIASTASLVKCKIEKNAATGSEIKEYMDNIVLNCNKVAMLVNNIMGINMVTVSKREYVNSKQFFDTFCKFIEPYCKYAETQFKKEFKTEKEYIHISVSTTERILLNLITNAIKYNDKENKKLTIKMYNEGDSIIFSVKDNGIGIAKENLDKITEKFFRLETQVSNGFGIGLSLVKEYLDQMGGTLEIKSQLKKGTEVIVSIPSTPENMLFISAETDYIYTPEKSVFNLEFAQININIDF